MIPYNSFLKKPAPVVDAERAAALAAGQVYTPPTRPITVSSVLVRLVGSCLLQALEQPLQAAAGPAQYAFRTKNGSEAIQVGVRVSWESVVDGVVLHTDIANAFNSLSRERLHQVLLTHPALAPLLPFFRLTYLDRVGELLYYMPGAQSPTEILRSAEGTRQGCVLGMPLFAVGFAPFLRWALELSAQSRHSGLPFAYADDLYLVGTPDTVKALELQTPGALEILTGLTFSQPKHEVLVAQPPGRPLPPMPLSPASTEWVPYRAAEREAIMVLGVPLGSAAACAPLLAPPRSPATSGWRTSLLT